ncbi:MAG: sigma-70 family RNA polymerase sigma factor [Pseudomonadota bacterium]|nr:sigma-70 family RNA polymerase sigma factor [Pseudomonadota bacterium]
MNLRAYQHAAAPRRVEGMTREEMCVRYQRKVVHLARRTCEQVGPSCVFSPEDLVGYGVMGLLEAFERFDDARGADFALYASRHIVGRMLDAVRGASGSTRRDRRVARELAVATKKAREALGREPTHEEIAGAMGASLDAYWEARGFADPVVLVSLGRYYEDSPEDDDEAFLQPAEAPARLLDLDVRRALRDAIGRLPERDRQVVLLYYARDCSLAEIGAILEVTPSRVSQLLTAARERLKKSLVREIDMDDLQEGAA